MSQRNTLLASAQWAAVVLALTATLVGCGPSKPGGVHSGEGIYQRLIVTEAEGENAAKEKLRLVESFLPPQELGTWTVDAPEPGQIAPVRGSKQQEEEARKEGRKNVTVRGVWLKGRKQKSLSVHGELDPKSFNQVGVQIKCYGNQPDLMRVVFLANGKRAAQTPWLSVPSKGKHPQMIWYELPELRRIGQKLDELMLEVKGETRAVAVSKIDLVYKPLHLFLPEPWEAPDTDAPGDSAGASPALLFGDIVTAGDEDRRGVGLSSRRPLVTTFEPPDHAELWYSYALLEGLRVGGEAPRLTVTLSAEGKKERKEQHRLEPLLAQRARWHEARISLAGFEGAQVTARFELSIQGEHEGFCAIAETALSRRGQVAPTVLLVTSDTHRADHMGRAGQDPRGHEEPPVTTPHLDRLADAGVFYTNAYASTNVTNPSHVALMTAQSPRDTRILNNTTPLAERATTLAEHFQNAGYRTLASVSAYHLLHDKSGLGQGFDRVNGPRKNDRDGHETVGVLGEWVAESSGQPLFVWLHLFDAHAPYGPPSPFDRKYYPDGQDPFAESFEHSLDDRVIPPFMKGLRDLDFPYQQYRAEVDFVDAQMGEVLGWERMQDGTVAFTADHGESFGEHGIWWDHADLYPETVHVPLILRWPGAPSGERSDEPVEQIDIGRTLLNLAGLESADFPGRDLRWVLEETPAPEPRFQISAHGFTASLESGGWLLVLHTRGHQEPALVERREAHQVELYSLRDDPERLIDLVREEKHYERAKRMREKLIEWLQAAPEEGLGTSKILSATELRSLEELGYGGGGGDDREGSLYTEDPENEWCKLFSR